MSPRPRPKTSKCVLEDVLEAKDVFEDSTSAKNMDCFNSLQYHFQFSSIGTDMMTTCHAAVLHCEKTKATALAHFDGCATFEGVRKMIELVAEISHCDVTDLSAGEFEFRAESSVGPALCSLLYVCPFQ